MKGIVELTELGSGNKFLMPVKEIKSILSDGESGVFIETGVDNKGRSTGVPVREDFGEVKKRLAEACE